jgi:hypothetical protein
MAVVYLTFDSEIDLSPADDVTKNFTLKLDSSNWTITDFLLGKTQLKVYHNEFFKGSHYAEGGGDKKYVIKGIVKMTVKPKVADVLLAGPTEWIVSEVKVTHEDSDDNRTNLLYVPKSAGASVTVFASLDKPSK